MVALQIQFDAEWCLIEVLAVGDILPKSGGTRGWDERAHYETDWVKFTGARGRKADN